MDCVVDDYKRTMRKPLTTNPVSNFFVWGLTLLLAFSINHPVFSLHDDPFRPLDARLSPQTDSIWVRYGALSDEDRVRLSLGDDHRLSLLTNPPNDWEYDCGNPNQAYDFEVLGTGIRYDNSAFISIPNPGSVDFVVAEVVYKGGTVNPSQLTINSDSESFSVSGVKTSPSGGYYYRTAFYNSPDYIQLQSIPNNSKAQSLVVYVFRNTDRNVSTSGEFVGTWLYQSSYCTTLDLATADHDRNVLVTVPLSEITSDGRVAIVQATAKPSNTSAEIIIDDYNQGDALNITPFVINNVPGTDNKVEICVISPSCGSQYGCGQSLVLAAGFEAESNCRSTPYEWSFECNDGKEVDLFGVGAKNAAPLTLDIRDPQNVYEVVAEVVYKGDNPGPYVYFEDDNGDQYKAYREVPFGGSSNVWVYRAIMDATSEVVYNETSKNSSLQSLVAFAFRENVTGSEQTGQFTILSGYNDVQNLSFDIPNLSATRNIDVELPISEMTNDGRYLLVRATAGGKTTEKIIYGPDQALGSCCLNVVRMTIPDVPAGTNEVDLTIDTRNYQNGQSVKGQSYVIAGAVMVQASCDEQCPLAFEYDLDDCSGSNPFHPSNGIDPSYINTNDCGAVDVSKIARINSVTSACTSDQPFASGKAVRLYSNHLSNWSDNGQKAFRFNFKIPGCVSGKVETFKFWNKAPYKDHNGNYNGYPAYYGFRVLKDGNEIYQKIDLHTSFNGWKEEIHALPDDPDFAYTGGETFTFEVMAYGPTGNGHNQWIVDQFEIYACCDKNDVAVDFPVPDKVCVDNPAVFEANDLGNGVYEWDFGPGAMPSTATGQGPHFVTWSSAGTKSVTLSYTDNGCTGEKTKSVQVEECNDIECGLISVTVDQNSDCFDATGKLNVDVCESCGTTYPITIYYKENGIQKQAGPFNNDGVILTGLPPGVYSEIYVVDNAGCTSNRVGPVTIHAEGLPNVSQETCGETECIITDKLENDGETRSFWLPGLPNVNDPRFRWTENGIFTVNENGTATLIGQIVSVDNPSCGFQVQIDLVNRRNWNQWSALGRSYKGCSDNDPSNNNYYQDWEYYEIAGTSKLTGFGCYNGTLSISHRPADYTYGFQIGQGANVFNCDVPGISAWFFYEGYLNGKNREGHGDINALGGCGNGIDDPSPETPVLTCPPCQDVACDDDLDPANLGEPTVNCADLNCNLSFVDNYAGTYPEQLTRTWTASCNGKTATCVQEIVLFDDQNPDFEVPDKICVDNPAVFEADDIGNGTYEWDFGPNAMPSTAVGIGPHFVTWSTAGTKTVKLTYIEGPCEQDISKAILVEECNDIECGLISVTIDQNSDCYEATGRLDVDVCESCGTTYPITVFYKQNGVQMQAGPFNNDGVILTDLPPGVYTDIYIVDAAGCTSNHVGPVTILAEGLPNVSDETCEETECIITDKLENDGETRSFWLPGLPNVSDPRFRWSEYGTFTVNENGTATLTGQIISVDDPSCGFPGSN